MATSGDKDSKESKTQQASRRQPSRQQANADQKQERGGSADRSERQSSNAEQKQGRYGSSPNGRVPIAEAMRLAAGQLAELLQCEPASVSSVKATDGGWRADVEVVEVERIPETTSVMGSYRVELDGQGNLLGYERTRRYARGQIDQRK
ncbi:gas vesicle protein [Streptomyces bathyalis]|uniref:Gas vesicle protein n=1 Tax=Streptomyces bathyalis TaxID=2710756 RepID=A0A7T1TB49_9ACTN|nr:gas vesicle protein [Streptomyces bathyalis]